MLCGAALGHGHRILRRPTAESFWAPHVVSLIAVPGVDAVSTADAVALGPASSGDAGRELAAASAAETDDPAGALTHLREAQKHLEEARFASHAAVLDGRVVELLIRPAPLRRHGRSRTVSPEAAERTAQVSRRAVVIGKRL